MKAPYASELLVFLLQRGPIHFQSADSQERRPLLVGGAASGL